MTSEEKTYFETTDLGLAATIVTLGYELESLDRDNPSRVRFVFKRLGDLDEVVQAYWRNELTINPLAYFGNVKLMKNRIYTR